MLKTQKLTTSFGLKKSFVWSWILLASVTYFSVFEIIDINKNKTISEMSIAYVYK